MGDDRSVLFALGRCFQGSGTRSSTHRVRTGLAGEPASSDRAPLPTSARRQTNFETPSGSLSWMGSAWEMDALLTAGIKHAMVREQPTVRGSGFKTHNSQRV